MQILNITFLSERKLMKTLPSKINDIIYLLLESTKIIYKYELYVNLTIIKQIHSMIISCNSNYIDSQLSHIFHTKILLLCVMTDNRKYHINEEYVSIKIVFTNRSNNFNGI